MLSLWIDTVNNDSTAKPDPGSPLLQSNELLEQVFEHLQVGVAYLDRDLNFLRVNRAYADANHQTPEFFTGKNHFELFPNPENEALFLQAISTGKPYSSSAAPFSNAMLPDLGTTYWNWSVQPVRDGSERVIGLLLTTVDVTEQKRTEIALVESRRMFQRMFESAPDATLLVRPNGHILAFNRQAELKFGYEREELEGQRIEHLIPERFHRRHRRHRTQYVAEPVTRPMGIGLELAGRRKDGSEFPVDVSLSPVEVEGEKRVICVVRDITRRIEAEKALQRQTGYVKLLQDIAVASNEADSVESALQYAVDRICRQMKWPVGHALLRDFEAGLASARVWHLDDPRQVEPFVRASEVLNHVRAGGMAAKVLRNGGADWFNDLATEPAFKRKKAAQASGLKSAFAFPILIEKDPVGVLEFFSTENIPRDENLIEIMTHVGAQLGRVVERERNRRALQRSEARFRTIFEESATGIQLTDVEGFFMETNPALQEMLGYTADELRNLGLTEVTHPDDLERNWDLLKSLLRGEIDRYNTETRYLRKDGTVVWAQLAVSSVTNESSQSEFVITLVYDITARKSMEAELAEVQRLLIASVETERARLARELHDGPLQDLYGAIYQMQDVIPILKESTAEAAAENTVVIIQQVISLLRSIVGELRPPVLGPFGLEKAIRAHTERLRKIYPNLALHLELMSDGLSLSEKARMALYRAYQQLITNVTRHAAAKNVWVRLELDPHWVKLEVEDDGKGFKLPLRWVELAREGRVGLLGVQERAESFGGKMSIAPGGTCGSRVTITVPRERVGR